MKKSISFVLSSALITGLVLVQAASLSAASSKSKDKSKDATTSTASNKSAASTATSASLPSAADIASAKSKGLVWLNVNTKVYHYPSDKVYGTTKSGKFVTEADAKSAGAKPAGGAATPAQSPAPTPTAKTVTQPASAPTPAKTAAPASAPTSSSAATPTAKTTVAKTAKTPPSPPPNAGDIAAAKGKGLVWLNLNTKVYHNSGDKEYGATKNGKFVTEAEAKAAGAKLASK